VIAPAPEPGPLERRLASIPRRVADLLPHARMAPAHELTLQGALGTLEAAGAHPAGDAIREGVRSRLDDLLSATWPGHDAHALAWALIAGIDGRPAYAAAILTGMDRRLDEGGGMPVTYPIGPAHSSAEEF